MQKICSVVMLPTEKQSNLFDKKGTLEYNVNPPLHGIRDLGWKYQTLYIISDVEIKKGDWYYNEITKKIQQCEVPKSKDWVGLNVWFKILATTDKSLGEPEKWISARGQGRQLSVHWDKWNKEERVPLITESFTKGYAESNGTIKEVLVEYEECQTWRDDACDVRFSCCNNPLKLKTNADNTIIISNITKKYKMQTKEQYSLFMLPTEKGDKDFLGLNTMSNNLYQLSKLNATGGVLIPQHLYITSKVIIKEGDWHILYGQLKQVTKEYTQLISAKGDRVIASTDRTITPNCWINLVEDGWIMEYYNKYKVFPSVQLEITEKHSEPDPLDFNDVQEYREKYKIWESFIPSPKTFSNGTVIISNPNTKKYNRDELKQECFRLIMLEREHREKTHHFVDEEDLPQWIDNNLKN